VEPEATRDLKPPPRTVPPPGQYNGSVARVSFYRPKIHPAQIRPKIVNPYPESLVSDRPIKNLRNPVVIISRRCLGNGLTNPEHQQQQQQHHYRRN